MLIIGNAIALVALLMSAYMSLAWGEAGSYDVHGDKSGLAGFGTIPMIMAVRWLSIALVLLIGVWRGGFDFVPGGRWQQAGIVIAVHGAIGYVAYRGFEAIIGAIQRSDASALGVAWVYGLALPLLVLGIALWGINQRWMPRHLVWAAAVAAVVVWAHVAAWKQGYRRPAPPTAAAPAS